MKKIFTRFSMFILFLFFKNGNAQTPTLTWAKSMGGSGDAAGYSTALDNSGNVYLTGDFSNTVDFDPGPGVFNLTSNGNSNVFVEKMDAAGNFIWAKSFGGINNDYAYALTVDLSANIFITGFFNGTVDFDPGTGVNNITSNGSADIFVEKMDANGNFIWAKTIGGMGYDEGNALALDATGNVYLAGSFADTVDFDPGPGIFNLIESSGESIYILKLDNSGNFVFAKSFVGMGAGIGLSISCDGQGNVYTTGFYGGTLDFDPGPGTYNLSALANSLGMGSDIFIQKTDVNGNFVWANSKGSLSNISDAAYSIKADAIGNIYTAGYLVDTMDFDPGPGTYNLISNGLNDIFIQKLDASGNFIWAKSYGSHGNEDVNSMALDAFGNIYIPGYFSDTVDFDPGPGTHYLISHGYKDIYILKLNASGNFIWAVGIGGSTYGGDGWSVAINASGDVYTTGYFEGTCDFDPNAGVFNLSSAGYGDIFILKLNQGASGISENENDNKIDLFPNPTSGEFTINTGTDKNNFKVEITTLTGQEIEKMKFTSTNMIKIDLKCPEGLYFVKVIDSSGKQVVMKVAKSNGW